MCHLCSVCAWLVLEVGVAGRIHFLNAGTHPHTIHYHGIHSAYMDGVTSIGRGNINPGESFTYEFDAAPYGCHLYHCHATPLKRHIHKGLYGAFIINPDPEKHGEGPLTASGLSGVSGMAGVRHGDERL